MAKKKKSGNKKKSGARGGGNRGQNNTNTASGKSSGIVVEGTDTVANKSVENLKEEQPPLLSSDLIANADAASNTAAISNDNMETDSAENYNTIDASINDKDANSIDINNGDTNSSESQINPLGATQLEDDATMAASANEINDASGIVAEKEEPKELEVVQPYKEVCELVLSSQNGDPMMSRSFVLKANEVTLGDIKPVAIGAADTEEGEEKPAIVGDVEMTSDEIAESETKFVLSNDENIILSDPENDVPKDPVDMEQKSINTGEMLPGTNDSNPDENGKLKESTDEHCLPNLTSSNNVLPVEIDSSEDRDASSSQHIVNTDSTSEKNISCQTPNSDSMKNDKNEAVDIEDVPVSQAGVENTIVSLDKAEYNGSKTDNKVDAEKNNDSHLKATAALSLRSDEGAVSYAENQTTNVPESENLDCRVCGTSNSCEFPDSKQETSDEPISEIKTEEEKDLNDSCEDPTTTVPVTQNQGHDLHTEMAPSNTSNTITDNGKAFDDQQNRLKISETEKDTDFPRIPKQMETYGELNDTAKSSEDGIDDVDLYGDSPHNPEKAVSPAPLVRAYSGTPNGLSSGPNDRNSNTMPSDERDAFSFLTMALREALGDDAKNITDHELCRYIHWKPDVKRAAERFRSNQKFRSENSYLFDSKPLRLSQDPKLSLLLQNGMALAPEELVAKDGSAVMIIRASKCDISKHGCNDHDVSRAIFFTLKHILERDTSGGPVVDATIVLDLVGVTKKNIPAKLAKLLSKAVGSFPIRVRAICVIAMPWWFPSGHKRYFAPKLRERIIFLRDKSSLSEFIEKDRMLEEDGGIYNFDLQSWISSTVLNEVEDIRSISNISIN